MPNPETLKHLPATDGYALAAEIKRAAGEQFAQASEEHRRVYDAALAAELEQRELAAHSIRHDKSCQCVQCFPTMTIAGLQEHFGSFRRMIEAYWAAELPTAAEREIEDRIPKEILIGYKPVI